MRSESFRVLIVGGGLGGLCLAQGLKKVGIAFTVFERDASSTTRVQGYRLNLTPDGSVAMHSNLPDDLWRRVDEVRTRQIKGISFVSEQLQRRFFKETPPPFDAVRKFGSIGRESLREILLSGLGDDVKFGKRMTRYDLLPDGAVQCCFEDGSTAEGSFLVGGDGTHSVVRSQLLPQDNRVRTGVCTIAGRVPFDETTRRDFLPEPLEESAVVMDHKPQGMFLASHLLGGDRSREDYVFWALLANRVQFGPGLETKSPLQLVGLADEMTPGWHPRLKSLIRRADPETVKLLHYKTSTRPERWPVGSVTLIGDAVHGMPPTGGEGANIALKDSAVLCGMLAEFMAGRRTLREAVDQYEAEMLDYAFPAVERAMSNLRRMVTRDDNDRTVSA